MGYQRKHLHTLSQRIQEERKFIQVVSGPRQVGKSTMVQQLVKQLSIQYHFISTEESGSFNKVWIGQQWETARLTILPSINERDSIGFKKPRAVLPRGFLQVPAADRSCGSLDRPSPSARRLIYFWRHLHLHSPHTRRPGI